MTKYDFQEKIAFFLISKGLNVGDTWYGKMKKAEQVATFGVYFGRGELVVNGTTDCVSHRVSIAYGADVSYQGGMSPQGFCDRFDNFTPINEINIK